MLCLFVLRLTMFLASVGNKAWIINLAVCKFSPFLSFSKYAVIYCSTVAV